MIKSKTAKKKECPDGQEINPRTGRCVKKCKENEERNAETGKCRKKKKELLKVNKFVAESNSGSDDPDITLYYPDVKDSDFQVKLANNMNFAIHKIPKFPIIDTVDDFNSVANKLCSTFETSLYQHFVSQYLSYKTPYKSILLYHGVGVGKTCSAITMSEALLLAHDNIEPMIWVIMPQALKQSFKSQIFDIENYTFENLLNQCTGDTYIKLLNIYKASFGKKKVLNAELKRLLKFRYKLFTYDSFAKYINENYKDKNVENKVIIVDEAHNIRSTNNKDKYSFTILSDVLESGVNNKLVLLSATPMYNEPRDILDLFKLMLLNDKRISIINNNPKIFNNQKLVIDDEVIKLIKKLSSTYISYLRGKNPFTFSLKLNPENSGIPVLKKIPVRDPSNKLIPKNELNWLNNIDNGIVTSNLSISQKEHIKKMSIGDEKVDEDYSDDIEDSSDDSKNDKSEKNKNMKLLQPMNIVYDDEIGNKGFFTFFTKVRETDPLSVKYTKKYENALMPTSDNLGKYSGKFLTICDIIKKSKGVVVIYSRFLYSGILPFAVCLEHMGYNREGANNILNSPKIIDNKPFYENVKNPKYCILTSDNKEIMGSTNIDTLINKINKPENINGELIKVILITPVASEGLSFYNAREIHLIEPWYHFNRSVQIIGRGIRNCRHQNLPLEYKNTTVFMHASVEKDNSKETIDLHAFRISTRKFKISNDIDNIINNNSLDCYLMKNINYFPKSLFKLGKIPIVTSQGVTIDYEYGDSDLIEPKCNINNKIDTDGFRKETYRHVTGNVITILKNLIINSINNDIFFINYKTLLKAIDFDEKVIMESIRKIIYPNVLLEDYTLIPHEDGIHIIKIQKNIPNKIKIILDETNSKSGIEEPKNIILKEDKETKLSKKKEDIINIDINNINNTFIALYSSLDNKTYISIVKNILENEILNERDEYIAKCLYLQGALIGKKEIKTKNNNTYIGYVNIFNLNQETNENLDATIYIKQENKYRDCTENEIEELKKNRSKPIYIPDMTDEKMPWGIYYPKKINKSDIIMNVFKIYTIGKSIGKKTGIDCTSLKKDIQKTILEQLNVPDADGKKFENCNIIVKELLNKGRLIMLPIYKPK